MAVMQCILSIPDIAGFTDNLSNCHIVNCGSCCANPTREQITTKTEIKILFIKNRVIAWFGFLSMVAKTLI
jgi:hypothetical protein